MLALKDLLVRQMIASAINAPGLAECHSGFAYGLAAPLFCSCCTSRCSALALESRVGFSRSSSTTPRPSFERLQRQNSPGLVTLLPVSTQRRAVRARLGTLHRLNGASARPAEAGQNCRPGCVMPVRLCRIRKAQRCRTSRI